MKNICWIFVVIISCLITFMVTNKYVSEMNECEFRPQKSYVHEFDSINEIVNRIADDAFQTNLYMKAILTKVKSTKEIKCNYETYGIQIDILTNKLSKCVKFTKSSRRTHGDCCGLFMGDEECTCGAEQYNNQLDVFLNKMNF